MLIAALQYHAQNPFRQEIQQFEKNTSHIKETKFLKTKFMISIITEMKKTKHISMQGIHVLSVSCYGSSTQVHR